MPRKDRALELKIENLLVDPKLTELCEVLRTGDDILDLIALPENGHSRILAWMFDPREGHGQGDQILRDLLLAAWQMAQAEHCGLRKNGRTAAFFGKWSPSKLRTTSFGSAFTLREVIVNSKDRIDLAVFVPDQSFVVLIENKAGSTHTGNQLERYYNGWAEVTKKNPKLRRFDPVFLALDRNFDPDESQIHPMSHQWLHLGYEWLRNSADRADVDLERGNAAARLVVNYCNRQTDLWKSATVRRAEALAGDLNNQHGEALHRLLGAKGNMHSRWMTERRDTLALRFMLQNRDAVAMLRQMRGTALLQQRILDRNIATLQSKHFYSSRQKLLVSIPGWEKYTHSVTDETGSYDYEAVYLRIRAVDDEKLKYRISLMWEGRHAPSPSLALEARKRLQRFHKKFGTYRTANYRHVLLEDNLSIEKTAEKVEALLNELGPIGSAEVAP